VEGRPIAVGQEWLVDVSGCRPSSLRDVPRLQALLDEVVVALGLSVIGTPQWHAFPGEGGVTGLVLLSESHLALHTFPEHGFAALSVYSCRERAAPDLHALLSRHLEPHRVDVTCVPRSAR
jgi:S-adenosylmethionine decarboxylase